MLNINHILLDLDGTLTDPKEGITKSIQHALERLGVEAPSMDDLEWTIGPPLVDSFQKLLNTHEEKLIQQAISFYRERYEERCVIENKPYDGIHETLNLLDQSGFALYLATSKPWAYAGKILDYFKLSRYFTGIYGSELDGTRDYKKDLIEYILAQCKLEADKTIMIGDRHYDILGAKHNKIRSVGVTYGYGSLEELIAAAPDVLCHDHRDIFQIVSTPNRID